MRSTSIADFGVVSLAAVVFFVFDFESRSARLGLGVSSRDEAAVAKNVTIATFLRGAVPRRS